MMTLAQALTAEHFDDIQTDCLNLAEASQRG
jgi:hypothetical protein